MTFQGVDFDQARIADQRMNRATLSFYAKTKPSTFCGTYASLYNQSFAEPLNINSVTFHEECVV